MTETIPSPTALDRPIAAWLAHQRALGRGFSIEERVLDSLRRCLARLPGADLDQAASTAGARPFGISTPTPGEPAR